MPTRQHSGKGSLFSCSLLLTYVQKMETWRVYSQDPNFLICTPWPSVVSECLSRQRKPFLPNQLAVRSRLGGSGGGWGGGGVVTGKAGLAATNTCWLEAGQAQISESLRPHSWASPSTSNTVPELTHLRVSFMFPVMKFILNLSIIIVRLANHQYDFVCFLV